jgi:hypothetical protein
MDEQLDGLLDEVRDATRQLLVLLPRLGTAAAHYTNRAASERERAEVFRDDLRREEAAHTATKARLGKAAADLREWQARAGELERELAAAKRPSQQDLTAQDIGAVLGTPRRKF